MLTLAPTWQADRGLPLAGGASAVLAGFSGMLPCLEPDSPTPYHQPSSYNRPTVRSVDPSHTAPVGVCVAAVDAWNEAAAFAARQTQWAATKGHSHDPARVPTMASGPPTFAALCISAYDFELLSSDAHQGFAAAGPPTVAWSVRRSAPHTLSTASSADSVASSTWSNSPTPSTEASSVSEEHMVARAFPPIPIRTIRAAPATSGEPASPPPPKKRRATPAPLSPNHLPSEIRTLPVSPATEIHGISGSMSSVNLGPTSTRASVRLPRHASAAALRARKGSTSIPATPARSGRAHDAAHLHTGSVGASTTGLADSEFSGLLAGGKPDWARVREAVIRLAGEAGAIPLAEGGREEEGEVNPGKNGERMAEGLASCEVCGREQDMRDFVSFGRSIARCLRARCEADLVPCLVAG